MKKIETKLNSNNIETENKKQIINKDNEETKKLNIILLNDKISNDNKLIKGFEKIKQYYYNKLMLHKKLIINKMKDSNNINKKIECMERINITFSKVNTNLKKYVILKIKKFIKFIKTINNAENILKKFITDKNNESKKTSFLSIEKYVIHYKKIEGSDKIYKYLIIKIKENIKNTFMNLKIYINSLKRLEATQKIFNFFYHKIKTHKKNSHSKIKEYTNKKKKSEAIKKIYNFYINKYNSNKDIFIYLKIYVNEQKKNEGIERFNTFFDNRNKIDINNCYYELKKYYIIKKELKGLEILNKLLLNKIIIIKLEVINSIDTYRLEKMKSKGIIILIDLLNKKRNILIKNIIHKIRNKILWYKIIEGFDKISGIFNKRKNELNSYFINKFKEYDDYIIKIHSLDYLEKILYKIFLFNKGIILGIIKNFSEKNIQKYNSNKKIGVYNEKNILNNKLNKSNVYNINNNNNKYTYVNKSQDNIISSCTTVTLSSKNSSNFGKTNIAKRWLSNNKLDNTNFNFKIESNNQRKIIKPSIKDSISFTISKNNIDKKSEEIDESDTEKYNDEEIWTINVEKWEVNQAINDSFYQSKKRK